jgi:putative transcription factor
VEFRKLIKVPQMEGTDNVLVKDFSKVIRKSREEKKLTQEELAKRLSEKVSVIKRMEEGWQPSDKLVGKIEKFFGIELKEKAVDLVKEKRQKSKKLTIGDVVDIG